MIYPTKMKDEKWMRAAETVVWEIREMDDEGRRIPQDLRRRAEHLPADPAAAEAEAREIYARLEKIPDDPAGQAREPDALEAIRALRCAAPALEPFEGDLVDRILGGWLGRCAGCLLGQPVESWMQDRITGFLRDTGNYPISRYLSSDLPEELRQKWDICDGPGPYDALHMNWVNLITGMEEDDDVNYTVFALKILERVGRNFTSEDVAHGWVSSLPFLLTCSAERVAYRNIVNLMEPPCCASYHNPYREWIGAQIRSDLFGWVNPCDPETAADMAWRDARISHTKNGIYGSMFVAGMCAAAFGCRTAEQVILQGLGQIPAESRLAVQVRRVLAWYREGLCAEDAVARIHAEWNEASEYDWCHVIPNAMLVSIALLWGGGDFTRTIGIAVQAGFDTDCNGATAGSVLGVMLGGRAIPAVWTEPMRNTVRSGVHGYAGGTFTEMAERTAALAKLSFARECPCENNNIKTVEATK